MANSFQQYVGDGSTRNFTVPFQYIAPAHISVKRNGTPLLPADYSWLNASTIQLVVAPGVGDVVEIRRRTPLDVPLVTFQNGAVLTEAELNTAVRQNLYATQEVADFYEATLMGGLVRLANGTYVTPEQAIDAAVQDVLDSALAADLQARITDIDANGESILDQALRLTVVEDAVDALTGAGGTGIITLITNETNARIAGDTAIVNDIALIGARNGPGNAFILDVDTVLVSPSESIGTRINYLTSTADGNTAAILTQQSVIDGLTAQYMVKLDVNGRVAGFGLYNAAGEPTQFTILANKFAVIDPGAAPGATPVVPFVIEGGITYIRNVVIENAAIQNLNVGKLTSGSLTATIQQNADILVGTGRIIWDNGSYIKASGIGFGTSNQFLEWFGPRPAGGNLSLCSEANAIQYLKTNGDAYFGGTLSAGLLKNAAATTSIGATPTVTVGPFTTNGNPKSVVVSYNFSQHTGLTGVGNASGAISATVNIYRQIGAGAETLWTTLPVSGTWNTEDDPEGFDALHQSMAGSVTLTDSDPSLAYRTYRATVSGRSIYNYSNTDMTQKLSIISTEE
jgi:hypothetical protein